MTNYSVPVTSGTPTNVPTSFVTNSGTAVPSSNILNVLGSGGVATAGSGNTITITATSSAMTWTDENANFNAAANNGYFCTAALTATLPAASQGNIVVIEVDTASPVVIQVQGTQFIQLGNQTSAVGGTATSSKTGDSLYLVYRNSTSTWHSISTEGTWAVM